MFDDTRGGGGGGDDDGDAWDEFRRFMRRPHHYILDGQTPKPAALLEWARWFETANRRLAFVRHRGLAVSTVFIGFDHAFDGPPVLFETGLFVGHGKGTFMADMWRAHTWAEAMVIHRRVVSLAHAARSGRLLAAQPWGTRGYLREIWHYRPD